MPATRRLLETSLLIAEALTDVSQSRPDLWNPQQPAWDPESLVLVHKIAEFLKINESRLGITGATEALLRKVLQPQFFTTEAYTQLITQVGKHWHPEPSKSVGAILLDADNQTLDVDKEQWLQEVTETAINYRFAFANWKTRNTDIDLKKRGYYLLHAPAGDDMADGLMIAFASTLPHHYSDVGRIFVCSNDRTFDTLVGILPRYGVTCYRVIQPNRHRLRIHDYQAGQTHEYVPPMPEKQEFIHQIIGLVRELKRGDLLWIPIPDLVQRYEEKYGLSIQDILKKRLPEHSSLTAFLRSLPRYFAVHSVQGREFLCCFTPPPRNASETQTQSNSRISQGAQEMITIIRDLLKSQGITPGQYVSPGLITTGFNEKFGHGILDGLRQRGLVANLRVFMTQNSADFSIKPGTNGQWEVAYQADSSHASQGEQSR